MPDLGFSIEKAEPVAFAVAPTLAFTMRLTNTPAEEVIHAVFVTGNKFPGHCTLGVPIERGHV